MKSVRKLFYILMLISFSLSSGEKGKCDIHLEKIKKDYEDHLFSKYIFQENFYSKIRNSKFFRRLRQSWIEKLVSLNGNSFKYIYLDKDLSFLADTFQGVSYKAVQEVENLKARFIKEAPKRYEDYKKSSENIDELLIRYQSFNTDLDNIFERVVNFRYLISQIDNLPKDVTFPFKLMHPEYNTIDDSVNEVPEIYFSRKDLLAKRKSLIEKLKEREKGLSEFSLEGREILQYKLKERLEIYLPYLENVLARHPNLIELAKHRDEIVKLLDDKSLTVNEIVKNYMDRHEFYEEIKYFFQTKVKTPDDVLEKMEFHSFASAPTTELYMPKMKIVGRTKLIDFLLKYRYKVLGVASLVTTIQLKGTSLFNTFGVYYWDTEWNIHRCLKDHLDSSRVDDFYSYSEKKYEICKDRLIRERLTPEEYFEYTGVKSKAKTNIFSSTSTPDHEKLLKLLNSIQKIESAWEFTMKKRKETKAKWEERAKEFAAES